MATSVHSWAMNYFDILGNLVSYLSIFLSKCGAKLMINLLFNIFFALSEMDNRDTYRALLRERSPNEASPDPPDRTWISRGKKVSLAISRMLIHSVFSKFSFSVEIFYFEGLDKSIC